MQSLKYYWNALPEDQDLVNMLRWFSNCGENPADLCVTTSENPADLCVTTSENPAGARKSNCRDMYNLATGARTQTNSTNVF